jgi:hypothetical protein
MAMEELERKGYWCNNIQMKISSLLNRLKHVQKQFKGSPLIVILAVVTVLLVGTVSVAAYTINIKKKSQPVAEKIQSKPSVPGAKVEPKSEPEVAAVVVEEKSLATESVQPTSVSTGKPVATPTKKPRPHTSEDPAFVICVQKYSDLYVKYNADNARINAEKNLALATLDELYNSGFYEEMYPGDTDQYNYWQIDRAELIAEYGDQLASLNNTYAADSSAYLNC